MTDELHVIKFLLQTTNSVCRIARLCTHFQKTPFGVLHPIECPFSLSYSTRKSALEAFDFG